MTGKTVLHYKILEPLGEGGMGVVYKAQDTKLGRNVAVKLLAPHIAPDVNKRRRFLREARAASSLNHPNIVTVYEVQTEGDTDVIVMEYVKGRTLLDLLRTGAVPLESGIDYALQMAEGLAKAHDAGIIHRDLKPSNVMVNDDGLVKLMDFGLAKLTQPGGDGPESGQHTMTETLTEAGLMMGTLGYMSPEQALGQTIDTRSDIFSYGVLVYEMFSGSRPFGGQTAAAVLHDIAYRPHMPLRAVKGDVPLALELLLQRCLAKSPEERFHTMHEVVEVLKSLRDSRRSPTIAGNTALGLSPKATGLLTGEWKHLRPQTSWKKRAAWIAAVVVLLTGGGYGVYRFLPSAVPGLRAAGSLDRPAQVRNLLDNFHQRGFIDRAVEQAQQWVGDEPDNATAHAALAEAYMRKNSGNKDPLLSKQMLNHGKRAIELEPNSARAQWAYGVSLLTERNLAEAEPPLRRAIELDPLNPTYHIWLGTLELRRKSPKDAEPHMRKAVQVSPDSWDARNSLGSLLFGLGRYEEARTELEAARAISPNNRLIEVSLGGVYYMLGLLPQAANAFQRSLDAQPSAMLYNNLGTVRFYQADYSGAVQALETACEKDNSRAMFWGGLADAYRHSPDPKHRAKAGETYNTAIEMAREVLAKTPGDIDVRSSLATYLAKVGRANEARDEARRVEEEPGPKKSSIILKLCIVHELTHDRQAALKFLRQAIELGHPSHEIEFDPELLRLRGDPEYQKIRALTPQPAAAR